MKGIFPYYLFLGGRSPYFLETHKTDSHKNRECSQKDQYSFINMRKIVLHCFLTGINTFLIVIIICSLLLQGCKPPRGANNDDNAPIFNNPSNEQLATSFNFYVENSGSMKGYFSGNGKSELETIINDYYDRLSENKKVGDTITLNWINTSVEKYGKELQDYLKIAKSKCNASYTKIDEILKMAMDSIRDDRVNIVVSDYCFTTNFGSLEMARSHITRLFTEQLNSNSKLAIGIFKYMVNFDGYYYPGGIRCNKAIPVYFWAFGNSAQIKRFSELKIKAKNCGALLLQVGKTKPVRIDIHSKRAVGEDNIIIVSKWTANRYNKEYVADVTVDLSDILLTSEDLHNADNYDVNSSSSSAYLINSISNDSGLYTFTVSTDKPSPGTLGISYKMEFPKWAERYSFEGTGLPTDSTTYGIKDLIGGVYDAFYNKSNDYFKFDITLKK